MIEPASLLKKLPSADIRKMTLACNRVGGINLSQGVCDLPTPSVILEAASKAILEDKSAYAPAAGMESLRLAIQSKLKRRNAISVDLEQILVTQGVTGAFTSICQALFNPGDRILLFEPYYGYHYADAILCGLEVTTVPLAAPSFEITRDLLNRHWSPDLKAVLLCSPSNPAGRIYTKEEIELVHAFCQEKGAMMISDEIYEEFYYSDNKKPISPLSLFPGSDLIVTMMGFSKTFSITGWRLGYAVLPKPLVEAVSRVNDLIYVCAPTPLQYGAVAALTEVPESYYVGLRADFVQKRKRLCEALERCKLSPIWPEGSYYVLADVSRLGCKDSTEAAFLILEKFKVASVPGGAFFQSENKDKYVRFCFAITDDLLVEACRRLGQIE